jgi:hypothetical protein
LHGVYPKFRKACAGFFHGSYNFPFHFCKSMS